MIRDEIHKLIEEISHSLSSSDSLSGVLIEKPKEEMGDYASNLAFVLSKELKKSPQDIALEIVGMIEEKNLPYFEKIEAKSGYVNFFLNNETLINELLEISKDENYGKSNILNGKKIMVEYTDANIMKPFHIGHLMSNAIGESIARLYESQGAEVKRANYYGDIGLHVAKTVWAMNGIKKQSMPSEDSSDIEKSAYLGDAYATGHKMYEDSKNEIDDVNKKLYEKTDSVLNELYQKGKRWSEEHVAKIHERLDTKFDFQFPESAIANDGMKYVLKGLEDGIFEKSDGAIVFKGEKYGLHTRVFITSNGLPLYEAKDFGLNVRKYELYKFNESIIITGNEQNGYFDVVLKAMSLMFPEVAEKTKHIGHGLMKLSTGKMSSRTGNVITGESLIADTEKRVEEIIADRTELTKDEKNEIKLGVALSAIKYTILKQGIGKDVIYDIDQSVSFNGDSGPYIQYTYARFANIIRKSDVDENETDIKYELLNDKIERTIIRYIMDFSEIVKKSSEINEPHHVALYIYQLSNLMNNFYEKIRILDDENIDRKIARVSLIRIANKIISRGLNILAIPVLEKI